MQIIQGTTSVTNGALRKHWQFDTDLTKYLENTSGITFKNWIYAEQIHGSRVAAIKTFPSTLPIPNADALVTNLPDTLLLTKHADCAPIFFHDPIKNVIGLAHSGFKGTVAQIASNVINNMVEQYTCNPSDINVTLGPCARNCCYTFTDISIFADKPEWLPYISAPVDGTFYINLPGFITKSLSDSGIQPQHITDQQICTIHDRNYHSWRYNKSQHRPLTLNVSYLGLRA